MGRRIQDVEGRVKKIICKKTGIDKKKLSHLTRFKEDLGMASLEVVELVIDFEKDFKIEISDEDAEKIQTVGQAIWYLKTHLPKPKAKKEKEPRVNPTFEEGI